MIKVTMAASSSGVGSGSSSFLQVEKLNKLTANMPRSNNRAVNNIDFISLNFMVIDCDQRK